MNGNGRPLSKRKKVQLLVLLTLLAWATQTLLHQWGYGAPPPPQPASPETAAAMPSLDADARLPAEKFVPAPGGLRAATLELRGEVAVVGREVRLRQLCRWPEAEAGLFLPIADLIVLRFDGTTPYKSISLDELKALLADAKTNLAMIRFSGPLLCTVRRGDAHVEPEDALQQWIDARQGRGTAEGVPKDVRGPAAPTTAGQNGAGAAPTSAIPAAARLAAAAPSRPAPAVESPAATSPSPLRSLRQLLTEDLSIRLDLPMDQLQIYFNPKDERVLNLSEPQFRFNLEAVRARNLGEVEWNVTIVHEDSTQKAQKAPIVATARAWQRQVLVARPLSARQIIRPDDVTERRTLVDRLNDEPLLAMSQLVGQQAGRDLKPGTVMTARMVEAVPLVKAGQYVTITVNQGSIRIKTAGRALEGGSYGQSIRVKNEATNDVYEVILTGPQEGSIGSPPLPSAPPPASPASPSDATSVVAARG